MRKFLVAVPYRRIVASLRYRNPEYTARTIMKTPRLKEAIIPEIAKVCLVISGMHKNLDLKQNFLPENSLFCTVINRFLLHCSIFRLSVILCVRCSLNHQSYVSNP